MDDDLVSEVEAVLWPRSYRPEEEVGICVVRLTRAREDIRSYMDHV